MKVDIFKPCASAHIYVCGACGKTSRTRAPSPVSDRGWDESCMLNAVLCTIESIRRDERGRIVGAEAVAGE